MGLHWENLELEDDFELHQWFSGPQPEMVEVPYGSAMSTSRSKSPLYGSTEAGEMHVSIGIAYSSGLV